MSLQMELAEFSNGAKQWVIVDEDGYLHVASLWLASLADLRRSPNTIEHYGRRVIAYLNWTAETSDWRRANLAHLRQWMRTVAKPATRSSGTVTQWMIALRSFYYWAESGDLLFTNVVERMTQLKYYPPGTRGGGEYGAHRRVLVPELRLEGGQAAAPPKWIESAEARARLEALPMNARDRFLVDLLYLTGIRAGEALSLFTDDMHFGGGSPQLGCNIIDGHFHVRMSNPTENGARAKGMERVLYVSPSLIDRYVDYIIERDAILGEGKDLSRHVFVNLYCGAAWIGRAMSESGVEDVVASLSRRIDFPLTGPHMLRHTFATRLRRGIDVEKQPLDVVQVLLGHRSIESTRIYSHDLETAKKAAMDAVQSRSVDLVGGSE